MYRFVAVLALGFITLASAAFKEECKKLGDPKILDCCKGIPSEKRAEMEKMKDCPPKDPDSPNCNHDICMAKKLGYAGSKDGTFEKKPLEATIMKDFAGNVELAQIIVDNCVYGDLKYFGPQDMCDLSKMVHCVYAHALMTCSDWTSEGECKGVPELLESCVKV